MYWYYEENLQDGHNTLSNNKGLLEVCVEPFLTKTGAGSERWKINKQNNKNKTTKRGLT